MSREEAARRRGNCERANVKKDTEIIAEFERFSHYAGIIIGLALGIMLFIGVIGG